MLSDGNGGGFFARNFVNSIIELKLSTTDAQPFIVIDTVISHGRLSYQQIYFGARAVAKLVTHFDDDENN